MSWLVDFNYSWYSGDGRGVRAQRERKDCNGVREFAQTHKHTQVHREGSLQSPTSSVPRLAAKRWGTRAARGVSAPRPPWPCTLMWSWGGTGDPEPSRTPRWGLPPLRKDRPCLLGWRRCCCSWIKKLDLERRGGGAGLERPWISFNTEP